MQVLVLVLLLLRGIQDTFVLVRNIRQRRDRGNVFGVRWIVFDGLDYVLGGMKGGEGGKKGLYEKRWWGGGIM